MIPFYTRCPETVKLRNRKEWWLQELGKGGQELLLVMHKNFRLKMKEFLRDETVMIVVQ